MARLVGTLVAASLLLRSNRDKALKARPGSRGCGVLARPIVCRWSHGCGGDGGGSGLRHQEELYLVCHLPPWAVRCSVVWSLTLMYYLFGRRGGLSSGVSRSFCVFSRTIPDFDFSLERWMDKKG